MGQDIKIGVNANTGGADAAINKIEKATDALANTLDKVDRAGKGAADSIRDVTRQAEALKAAQAILERELGHNVGMPDTQSFLKNFDRMRTGSGMGSRRLRDFDSFENWYLGHTGTFKSASDAASHRRRVLAAGMQGTSYAAEYGAPPPPPPPGGGGIPGGTGGGNFGQGVQKAQSMALAFGKSMLALAGLNSVMGMASSAVDMSTEEKTGVDTLKRRSGDLGVSFDKLEDQVRGATEGLGVTYVESTRLAQQFAKTAGDLRSLNLGDSLRSGIGFSRAYGLDPTVGVQFFANMSRMKVGAGDPNGDRKLALLIGDAVNSGGYSAKADEVLSAVSDYSQQITRLTLSGPNVGGYTANLAALMGTGMPGLDPAGAASLLSTADASVRRGGGMGQAGMNFEYAALAGPGHGMDPVTAQGLMAGGMFGTTAGTFGSGSILGKWYASHGLKTPALTGITNYAKIRSLMRRQYGSSPYYLDAMKNLLGLSSIQQAAALDGMNPADLGASSRLLAASGLDISKVSASGIQGIAKIAGAKGFNGLAGIYASTMGRSDLSAGERNNLGAAFKSGDVEKLRQALVKVVGTHEQEQTEGSQTRQTIADLKNELTRIGGLLLIPLNAIRDGVTMMARAIAPEEYEKRMQAQKDAGTDFGSAYSADGPDAKALLDEQRGQDKVLYARWRKGHPGEIFDIDSFAPQPSLDIAKSTPKNYDYLMAQRQDYGAMMKKDYGFDPSKIPADLLAKTYANDKKLGLPRGTIARQIQVESGWNPTAKSPKGAMGLAQVMPATLASVESRLGRQLDPYNPDDSIDINYYLMKENLTRYHGGTRKSLMAYNAGPNEKNWNNSETQSYPDKILGTPIPDGHSLRNPKSESPALLAFTGEATLTLKDTTGKPIGTAKLKPYVTNAPAGMTPIPGVM